ncbi:hypothetical protein [Streptomyces sp. NPDC058495]|uniref:hypothetical protein n=1 Tax=unclassified Streptomyces TaxID=2593676 RepID=UPI003667A6E4
MTTPRQNPLYLKYMGAFDIWSEHAAGCTCTAEAPCATGEPLFARLSRLQEAWNNHLNQR